MFLQLLWSILLYFSVNVDSKSMKPEKVPSSSMIKSSLKSMENACGAPWTNSCTCLYKILIGTNGNCFTKCFLGQFLQASSLNPHQKSMGNAPGTHLGQVLSILSISFSHRADEWLSHTFNTSWKVEKSMEHVLATSWANSSTFLHKTIIEVYGICSKCFLDQFLQFPH